MRHGGPRRTGSPFVLQDDDQVEVSPAEPASAAVGPPDSNGDDAAERASFERAMRQRRMRQEASRGGLPPDEDEAQAGDGDGNPQADAVRDWGEERRKAGERKNAVADAGAASAAALQALAASKASAIQGGELVAPRLISTPKEKARRRSSSSSVESAAASSDEEQALLHATLVPGFDSPSLGQNQSGSSETQTAAVPGTLVIDLPEPEPELEPGAEQESTPLSAIIDRRRKMRRGSAAEMAMLDSGDDMNTSADKWKEGVKQFYKDSTGGAAQTENSKRKALDFLAKSAVRQRQEAQDKLEEASAAAEAEEAEARKKRREGKGEEGDETEEDEDEESYGTRGTKLRPVGVDADKDWGDTGAIWDSKKVDYPRFPGREVCVRYSKTGRCKFCDEGLKCNFDHPPPPKEVEKERKYLRKKGLRVMRATWGNFTRKGKAVPGKSIDVTNALNAMIVEQGGVQLELPKKGKAHLPGFGDPCPGMKKQLRMEIVLSGGGKRTTKKKYKEDQKVLIYTRRTKACLYTKNCLAFSCPILGLLIGILFAARWMWGNLYQGCVDADFSECSVNDGTFPVVTEVPCIIPYNFSSENVESINVAMERGDVNITVAPTPENLIIIEIQHIAKSNPAIIGMSSSAVLEDGVINVENTWNDSHTEDAEQGPIHTLNCFRGIINITLPPDMAYLRPKLNVNITAKPNVCSIWNPSGCNEEVFLGYTGWEWSKMVLALEEPFIEPYGNIYINSQAWYGLETMANGVGFLWTSLDLSTNAGKIETHEVELSDEVGPEAVIACRVDPPPDYALGHPGHPELGEKGDVVVHDSFAHRLAVTSGGGGRLDASNLELFATEGQFAKLGALELNATDNGGALIQRVRHGDIDVSTEDGDVEIYLGPRYFEGGYSVVSPSAAVTIRDVNFTKRSSGGAWIEGVVGVADGAQRLSATSIGATVQVVVADALDGEPLRPRPVDGIRYPCQVNPNGPGCHGPSTEGDCTSCGR